MTRPAERESVAAASFDSPIGRLGLLATEAGLAKVAFAAEPLEPLIELVARRLGARPVDQPRRLDPARRQLEQYFDRSRRVFDLKVDLGLVKGFGLAVVKLIDVLPYGRTADSGDRAKGVGRPGAARAVGRACAANPVPVVIACHRVIRADGALGGFGGGLAAKRALLALEGVKLA
jgi:methylated-DNA-[protein]-cysteine S-methyltransferase